MRSNLATVSVDEKIMVDNMRKFIFVVMLALALNSTNLLCRPTNN